MAGFNYRGAWTPATSYAVDDAYTEAGSTYAVISAYTSGSTFGSLDSNNSKVIAQAGAQGPTGPAGTVTATGVNGNFDVPGVLTNAGGYYTAGTRTNPSGSAAIPSPDQFASFPTFTGSGYSLGNAGGWTVQKTLHLEPQVLQRGIAQTIGFAQKKYATGDTAGIYGYVRGVAGTTAQSDEGLTGATLQVTELNDLLKGHLITGSPQGSTVLNLTASNNSRPVDGGMLLNLTTGTLAGSLNGNSVPVSGTFLNALPVTGVTLPQTTAWGVATGPIANPGRTADSPVLVSVTVTLQPLNVNGVTTYPAFTAGGAVSIAGNNYPEQAKLDSVDAVTGSGSSSQQTLHLYLRNPNEQAVIFQGGVAGHYLSFDANLAFSGIRSSYYVFGSLTGTDLIYGVTRCGNLIGNFLPVFGVEAARNTGPAAAFHLYPGAEVVKGPSSNQALDITLEANNVVWNANDQVENTAGPYFSGTGLGILWLADSPSTGSQASVGMSTLALGRNVSGGYINQRWINGNPPNYYQPFGGPLYPPNLNLVDGVWQDWFRSYTTPLGNLFKFLDFTDPNQNIYHLFDFPISGGEFRFERDKVRYYADKFGTYTLDVGQSTTTGNLTVTTTTRVAESGILIPDTATGALMRIQVTNGALTVSPA